MARSLVGVDFEDSLPLAPSCALDDGGLRLQHERYRVAGQRARVIERTARSLVVDLDRGVDAELVGETIAVGRGCCPFFGLTWDPDRWRLGVSVSQEEYEPALAAIAFALGVDKRDRQQPL